MKKKKILIIVLTCICLIIVIYKLWNMFQEWVFFHPWHDLRAYKKLQNIDEFEEIEINEDAYKLSGWLWKIHGNERAPLVIFFTGNAQNSSNTMYTYYNSGVMKDIFDKFNLMIVDYPGYGMSKGKPSDDSMFEASNIIYKHAANMEIVDENRIVIIGYSIGTGVASYCASVNEASGLILVAPYDKALSLYNDYVDSFHGSVANLARYSFDSSKYAENVIEPTLIFTSKSDEVINYRHSLDLAGHFPELEDVVILESANHNGYFSTNEVRDGIRDFLNKIYIDREEIK